MKDKISWWVIALECERQSYILCNAFQNISFHHCVKSFEVFGLNAILLLETCCLSEPLTFAIIAFFFWMKPFCRFTITWQSCLSSLQRVTCKSSECYSTLYGIIGISTEGLWLCIGIIALALFNNYSRTVQSKELSFFLFFIYSFPPEKWDAWTQQRRWAQITMFSITRWEF